MRNLAAIIARLKGGQYDGAVIIKAVWERGVSNPDTPGEPIIIKENKKMLICRAVENEEALTVSMLLEPRKGAARKTGVIHSEMQASILNPTADSRRNTLLDTERISGKSQGGAAANIEEYIAPAKEAPACWKCISAQEVLDFVLAVNDTNPIHRTTEPIVPGMQVMESILQELKDKYPDVSHLELKFRHTIYALKPINLVIIPAEKTSAAGTVSVEPPDGNAVYISGIFQ